MEAELHTLKTPWAEPVADQGATVAILTRSLGLAAVRHLRQELSMSIMSEHGGREPPASRPGLHTA